MENPHKPGSSRSALAVLAAACLTAWTCQTGCMDDASRGQAYTGSISTTCAPAGRLGGIPALLVLIDETPVSACGDSMDSPSEAETPYHIFSAGQQVSWLKAGSVLTDTIVPCPDKCAVSVALRFEVEKVSEDSISGTLEVREIGSGGTGKGSLHALGLKICSARALTCI